jgi:hypothetical protein
MYLVQIRGESVGSPLLKQFITEGELDVRKRTNRAAARTAC